MFRELAENKDSQENWKPVKEGNWDNLQRNCMEMTPKQRRRV